MRDEIFGLLNTRNDALLDLITVVMTPDEYGMYQKIAGSFDEYSCGRKSQLIFTVQLVHPSSSAVIQKVAFIQDLSQDQVMFFVPPSKQCLYPLIFHRRAVS